MGNSLIKKKKRNKVMENLDKKRRTTDSTTEELQSPVDKRACSSSEEELVKPDSHMGSTSSNQQEGGGEGGGEGHEEEEEDGDGDTVMEDAEEAESIAQASVSGRSDDYEDEGYSDDDDEDDEDRRELTEKERAYQEHSDRRFEGDQETFKSVIKSLSDENTDVSEQLTSLTQLCEVLSLSTQNTIKGSTANALSPILVRLSGFESNPDIMLFSLRAIAYLVDVMPQSSVLLVRDEAVPALCGRLMAVEYLDVAEQCLLALEKISKVQPVVCLQAGTIMAVLGFIDFFSLHVQRVAVNVVVNVCQKLSSDTSSHFMDAVPVLCNLLQYEDQKLVANVVTCLVRITETVGNSPKMVEQLCEHRLIQQVMPLIALGSQTSFNQPIYGHLIGLLSRLASGSANAVKILLEQKISCILKNILSSYDSKASSLVDGDANSNQVYEVLKLLNVLLPPVSGKKSSKEKVLKDQPELLRSFGIDIVPTLVEVVNGGANLQVTEGCVSVINKLVNVSRSDILFDILDNTNISSFLAGVFARKDHHVLISALNIVQTILKELPDMFLNPFAKEGVVYAIDAILTPSSPQQKLNVSNDVRCLCYNLSIGKPRSSETGNCKLEKDSVHTLAKHIKGTYFSVESQTSEIGLTETLQKLRKYSTTLNDMVNLSMSNNIWSGLEENLFHTLGQMMMELTEGESVSTFEFIESGVVKSLLNYFSNGQYLKGKVIEHHGLSDYSLVIMKRFATFASFSLSSTNLQWEGTPLAVLVRKLQVALSSLENFPVILNQISKPRAVTAAIPTRHTTMHPCLMVRFVKEEGETDLCDDSPNAVNIEPFISFDAIEKYLWSQFTARRNAAQPTSDESDENSAGESEEDVSRKPKEQSSPEVKAAPEWPKLNFFLNGRELDLRLTLYQAILQLQVKEESDMIAGKNFWYDQYRITFKKAVEVKETSSDDCLVGTQISTMQNYPGKFYQHLLSISGMLTVELPYNLEKSDPVYEILFLLKILKVINKSTCHLLSHERVKGFAEGKNDDLDSLTVTVCPVPQSEFVSSKLTEKLEQQMVNPLVVSAGALPSWCSQLMAECPFLFSFEARNKYFLLTAVRSPLVQSHSSSASSNNNSSPSSDRRSLVGNLPRKKFRINRTHILSSAAQLMDSSIRGKVTLEVEYTEEVGTGLGPTLEFYTLVSREFQKLGLGMWREDRSFPSSEPGFVVSPSGLFPRPWSATMEASNGVKFSEVLKRFLLLGQVAAKALQDGRVLDLPLSKAFYKLALDQDLNVHDIQSLDPGLGRTLLEFQALVDRKRILSPISAFYFRNTNIDDLCLDFTLPGYPDYLLTSRQDHRMVNTANLEEYVSLIVDATLNSGILRQVEAFKSGFNQVFPITSLKIFTGEEIDRLLCGEKDSWTSIELVDHIKFDHGYTASSPPIINLLEIMKDLQCDQQQAFIQFVTGAPRLPYGGLAALNPKMTIVRKTSNDSNELADGDLHSVMTCANYLKLPPYSTKDIMKEKLLYAITEGQGSFHLS